MTQPDVRDVEPEEDTAEGSDADAWIAAITFDALFSWKPSSSSSCSFVSR